MTDEIPNPNDPSASGDPGQTPEVEAQPYDSGVPDGKTYDMPPPGGSAAKASVGSTTLGAVCHLLGLADFTLSIVLIGIIAPLILWLTMKDQDPLVDFAGKESINFQINLLVWAIAGFILTPCLIGIPILLISLFVLPIAELVLVILAVIKTAEGERYRYPFIFRILV